MDSSHPHHQTLASIQSAVYQVVKSIPLGQVMTYGQVAQQAHLASPRLVGRALHLNPDPAIIPCHRVVFSNGALSPHYAFGGQARQHQLLLAEGVVFKKDKVDLSISLL